MTMQREVIYECAGFRVLKRENAMGANVPAYAPSDVIALPYESARHGVLWDKFMLGDVMSYALSYGEDPFAAVQQAVERGHKVYWANKCAVSISNSAPAQKPVYFGQKLGDVIQYAGKLFKLVPAANQNVELVEVQSAEA
jgi:hypothetical protein